MNNVVTRSFVLLAVATATVLVSAFVAPPGTATMVGTNQDPMAGMDMGGRGETVNSEETFITAMIPHHREAVESARAVLATTQRPEVRDLARNVIATQTEEIALLEGWRNQWYPDAAEADYTPMMADPAGLSPDAADRTFLEGMIEHHQGAIAMARSYLGADYQKQSAVADLAEAIVTVQDGEIAQMQGWLAAWYGDAEQGAR